MLFTPYDSFDGPVSFLNAAAKDPAVQTIQMTQYRLGPESPVVTALIAVAKNGKDVTAVIELKTSFEEEDNSQWATKLSENGVTVIHGVPGLKVHAKCCLVTRREGDKTVRYATISTGNYNAKTARIYSDISLFTTDSAICRDATVLFAYLAGKEGQPEYKHLLISPDFMEDSLMHFIQREIDHRKRSGNGHIVLKISSLTNRPIINALYEASSAGARIDLIVRDICMLRPDVPNLSVLYFRNDGDEQVFISSPDMMSRNLKRRVETICPVLDRKVKNTIINRIPPAFHQDAAKGYVLEPDGGYLPPRHPDTSLGAQQLFIAMRKVWW
ncbi:MAG: phospholipase D-like domain-containing protein [Methanocorpusculum sp.]|nr:phospholipase D-like domain-containing protein [Methanocorpusculum sp.]